ncbi:MAG: radical SAM protein [Spirochaetales bacterium]|nr:radical SAM protein [Spirochaetales bacterium]
MGLAYIAAYLLSKNIDDVAIIDMTFQDIDEALSTLDEPVVFGMYLMTPYLKRAGRVMGKIKSAFPDIPIVAGGPHSSVTPEDVLERFPVAACVRGEGEVTFHEIVAALHNNEGRSPSGAFSGIRGVTYRDHHTNTIIHNPDRPPVSDLDTLPFPARDLLPMRYYLKGGTQKTFSYRNIRATTIITSRGCPHDCSFCQPTLRTIFGKRVRFRSIANVMEEIGCCVEKYSLGGLFILDDTFTCRKQFVLDFCVSLKEKGITVKIAINSRVDSVDGEMLESLKQAGVVTVMYGIESGNREILDDINKGITPEQIERAVRLTKEKGIGVYGYFMIGSPLESTSTLRETFRLARRLPFDEVQFSMAAPYRGSGLHEKAKTMNLIVDERSMESDGYFSAASMRTLHLSSGEVKRYHTLLNLYSRYKSLKNLLLRHPGAVPSLVANRIIKG